MNRLIKAELKKIRRLKITSVGYISILLSALVTCIQAFTVRDGAIAFSDFTDMYLYNNTLLFYPFMLALLGGYMIDREYALDTLKNLLVIPVKWADMVKAKILVLLFLAAFFSFLAASISGICGLMLKCPDFTPSLFLKKGLSFLVSGSCICVGILPVILWFSGKKGTYMWGSILSALLGISGVFTANGRLANWHPITYCFPMIFDGLTASANSKILMSAAAFSLYLSITFLTYRLICRKNAA